MYLRKDALVGAAAMVMAVRETVHQMGGRLVGTVGCMEIRPGGTNVIPGTVHMSVELRDMEAAIIRDATRRLAEQARQIAERYGLAVDFTEGPMMPSVPAHPAIQAIIEQEAQSLGLPTKRMVSGAGHDAQHMAEICPAGMIFIPGREGISHSPLEWGEWSDAAAGVQVLLQSLLRIDAG